MEAELIFDFMKYKNALIYEGGTIELISVAGEWVMFHEKSDCGYYREYHRISLLEITAWIYHQLTASTVQ